jgi:hypothetical protein
MWRLDFTMVVLDMVQEELHFILFVVRNLILLEDVKHFFSQLIYFSKVKAASWQ